MRDSIPIQVTSDNTASKRNR